MPRNVEIKARVRDLSAVKAKASELVEEKDKAGVMILQRDTFFNLPKENEGGRLKLRFLQGQDSQLIYYLRTNQEGPKMCDYSISHTAHPEQLETTLAQALGKMGEVRKTRHLFLLDRTRIHCDKVEGLGDFVELEVVLTDSESEEDGVRVAEEVMAKLGVDKEDLIAGAYVDLIIAKQAGK